MSHILSTIFSLFFIFIAFLFGTDLVVMQYLYTDLDSISIQANYLIAKNGYLTDEIKDSFTSKYNATIYPIESNSLMQSYEEGFIYGYILEKDYSPIAISKSTINLKIKRFAVINIYN
jgi:hypothetical protein